MSIIGEKQGVWAKLRRPFLLLAALGGIALLLRLGFWQLARAAQKQQELQAVAAVLQNKEAQPLATALSQTQGYTWVQGRVRFLEAPLLLLDNQRRGAQVGVSVYQLAESDDGRALLVDIGWLPVDGRRQMPQPTALHGSFLLEGLLSPMPSPGLAIGPSYMPQHNGNLLVVRMDHAALAAALKRPLAERLLRLDPALAIGFQRDLLVQSNTLPPEKHRAYALQWFALAALLTLLSIGLIIRKKHAR